MSQDNVNVSADTATVSADTVVVPQTPALLASRTTGVAIPLTASENTDRVDDRRDWAIWAVIVGGVLMTAFSVFSLILVKDSPNYSFYLGLAAMVNVFVVLTGLLGLLVKRSLIVSRTGIEVRDSQDQPS